MYIQNMKRGAVVFLLLLAIVIIASVNTYAFGLSTPYIKDETLLVNPGKTYEYTVTLQNNDVQEYYVDIAYSSTEYIAMLERTEYYVPANTYNITFSFILKIPDDALIGQTYTLEYAAKPRINGSGTVSMGVEIRRGITILVTDGTTNTALQTQTESVLEKKASNINIDWVKIGKYLLLIIVLAIVVLITGVLWRLSKRISERISTTQRTKYTISEAISLEEVKKLLQSINDEAFEVSEIKSLFKDKLSELTTNDISHRMQDMTRKELIREIDKIKK